jgi:hypothetical protein
VGAAVTRKTLMDALVQLNDEISQAEQALNLPPPNGDEATPSISKVDVMAGAVEQMIGKMRRINETLRGL